MRAGSAALLGLLAAWLPTLGTEVSAHRLDEYLHAARLAIDSTGVRLELSLTPGIAVADAVIRDIDADRDAVLSPAERRTYSQRLLNGLLRHSSAVSPIMHSAREYRSSHTAMQFMAA